MTASEERHSKLAPLSILEKIRLTYLAIEFFSPLQYKKNCATLGIPPQTSARPFQGSEFLNYLEKTEKLTNPYRYMYRISELLRNLSRGNVLTEVGHGHVLTGANYYFLRELTARQAQGLWWWAPALGPEFLYHMLSMMTFQITGADKDGNVVAGTGLALSSEWLLTCAHVLTDMKVDRKQTFGGARFDIAEAHDHSSVDVGLLRVVPASLPFVPGISFCDPVVGENIYTLGYPRVPLSQEPSLVMHRGEITNASVLTFQKQRLFLYSAIARPGNSGGPIVSESGQIVGIVSDELSDPAANIGLPFYGGVSASEIAKAANELLPTLTIPVEDYR